MTTQEAIAQFLDEHCPLPRMQFPYSVQAYPRNRGIVYGCPSQHDYAVETLADHFLALPEFEALRLGSFLGTVEGQVIAEAVELVVPPFYRQDVELLVGALTYAAKMQARGDQRAGLVAVGAIGLVGALAYVSTRAG